MTAVMRALAPVLRVRRMITARPRDASRLEARLRTREYPETAAVPRRLAAWCVVEHAVVDGRPVIMITPRVGGTGVRLVHLHGGSYVFPLIGAHWALLADLIERTGATVTVPLYGLAPEFDVDDALPFLDRVLDGAHEAAGAHPVFLSGDSAGGGLAVAHALRCSERGTRRPAGLALISPWFDVTLGDPDVDTIAPLDTMLRADRLRVCGALWAGGRELSDPAVSPLHAADAELATLPPVRIVQGGRDILLPDVRSFGRRLRAAGVDARTRIYPDGFHDFVGVPALPESRDALAWLASFIASSPGGAAQSGASPKIT